MTTLKEQIRAARRPERSYDLCLRGDLQAEWERLDRRLADLSRVGMPSLEGDERTEVARRMEELRAEMEGAQITLTVRALRPDEFRDLEAQHPARKAGKPPKKPADDADEDALAAYEEAAAAYERQAARAETDLAAGGVNVDTFYLALVKACVVEDLDEDDWTALYDAMTDRQFNELAGNAFAVNRGEVAVPFSPTASRLTRGSTPS